MDRTATSLDSLIGLMRSSDLLKKVLKKDIANYDLNMTEFAVIELLYHKGEQPTQQIGERILIASSSTTYVLDKLVEKKLVARRACSEDKRITYASITSEGKALMEKIFPPHAEKITEIFSVLTDEELGMFKESLKKISQSAKG